MTANQLQEPKVPVVRIKKSLTKYREQSVCASKLAKVNELLRDGQIPPHLLPDQTPA